MKIIITSILFVLFAYSLFSQTTQSIMDEVNSDTLLLSLEVLTGEKPTDIIGTIPNRNTNLGKEITRLHLEQKLNGFGLETEIVNYRPSGYNVIATQKGTKYPDSSFIICAHYDSVDDFCADDNASGTSAVIEAARILSKYKFEYTIIYALWDEEEKGLIGSYFYSDIAKKNNENIVGVLNLDMIGYDGNGDYLFEVHVGTNSTNDRLSDMLSQVLDESELDLQESIQIPGTDRSDHNSFWRNSYPAIFITEGFYNNDFNPTYHSSNDRIAVMSLDYHYQISKLVISTLFNLATFDTISSIDDTEDIAFNIYPNPITDIITLKKNINIEITDIKIYNLAGRELLSTTTNYIVNKIDVASLYSGVYYLVVNANNTRFTRTFIKL